MKILSLIAVIYTAAILSISFNSNSFGNEIGFCECCNAQCTDFERYGSSQASTDCCTDNCSGAECNECCASGNCNTNKSGRNSEVKKESTVEVVNSCNMNKTQDKAADCCNK